MAFTNVWSNIIPAGSDPANTADDEIRQLRLDVDERMDTLVGDWSADPIVVLTAIRKTKHWSDGSFDPLGSDTLTEGYKVFGVGLHPAAVLGNLVWRINLSLPVGAVLQTVTGRVFRDSVLGIMAMDVVEADDATPSEFSLATVAASSLAGWHDLTLSTLALTVAQDKPLLVKFNLASTISPDHVRIFQVHYEYDLTHALQGITG